MIAITVLRFCQYLAVIPGLILLGTNFAFIFRGHELFAKETVRFWQAFFFGKCIITGYLCWSVENAVRHPWAKIIVADTGVAMSLIALVYLYKSQAFLQARRNRCNEPSHAERTPPT